MMCMGLWDGVQFAVCVFSSELIVCFWCFILLCVDGCMSKSTL
jgi:hypothetical protein